MTSGCARRGVARRSCRERNLGGFDQPPLARRGHPATSSRPPLAAPCLRRLLTLAAATLHALPAQADNGCTDCDRASKGGFNARVRLDRERQIFFSMPYSMGRRPMHQAVQTDALCLGLNGLVPCVEIRRRTVGRVTGVTLNVPGSCSNLCDTAPDAAESAARNAASVQWQRQSVAVALARRSAAVMIISQAGPGWDQSDPTRAPLRDPRTPAQTVGAPEGCRDFLLAPGNRTAVPAP